jgi:hypothetical protein
MKTYKVTVREIEEKAEKTIDLIELEQSETYLLKCILDTIVEIDPKLDSWVSWSGGYKLFI